MNDVHCRVSTEVDTECDTSHGALEQGVMTVPLTVHGRPCEYPANITDSLMVRLRAPLLQMRLMAPSDWLTSEPVNCVCSLGIDHQLMHRYCAH